MPLIHPNLPWTSLGPLPQLLRPITEITKARPLWQAAPPQPKPEPACLPTQATPSISQSLRPRAKTKAFPALNPTETMVKCRNHAQMEVTFLHLLGISISKCHL